MKYLAIDVETANRDYASLCQIGIAEFHDGEVIDTWSTLINPEDYFDPSNIAVHGIREKDVRSAPTFRQVFGELEERIRDRIIVHHMPFDRVAINRACEKYHLNTVSTNWLDSAKIVRRTWDEFAHKGYGLANISHHLNIEFKHHDALEDAIAAGKVVHQACLVRGLSIQEWLFRVNDRIKVRKAPKVDLLANPDGHLHGQNLVFTGQLSLSRAYAKELACKAGCKVADNVTKSTTMLVLGNQGQSKLAGFKKSSKYRKAENLVKKGIVIRILTEEDFLELCAIT